MMHWTLSQWIALIVPNLVTTFAYFYIPYRIKQKASKGIMLDAGNAFLFQAFIKACGIHHLTHMPFMFAGWYMAMLAEAVALAAISLFAAIKLELK